MYSCRSQARETIMNVSVRLICPRTLRECGKKIVAPAMIDMKTPVCGHECAEEYALQRGLRVIGVGSTFKAGPCTPVRTNYSTGQYKSPTG